jgi:DNA-binding Lrp family transcriptional regulator
MNIFQLILGIFGTAVGFLGFMVAVLQTVRNRSLRNTLKRMRRAEEAEIWTNIGIVVRTFDSLNEARELICSREKVDHEVLSKIQSARRGTIDQYRQLLKEAVLHEPVFNRETIEKWKRIGRLENEWRVRQAERLLSTKDITADGLYIS